MNDYSTPTTKLLITAAAEEAAGLVDIIVEAVEDSSTTAALRADVKVLMDATWGDYDSEAVLAATARIITTIERTKLWRAPLRGLYQLISQDVNLRRAAEATYKMGWYSVPTHPSGRVHIVKTDRPLCGSSISPNAEFHTSSVAVDLHYVDCTRCRNRYVKAIHKGGVK